MKSTLLEVTRLILMGYCSARPSVVPPALAIRSTALNIISLVSHRIALGTGTGAISIPTKTTGVTRHFSRSWHGSTSAYQISLFENSTAGFTQNP